MRTTRVGPILLAGAVLLSAQRDWNEPFPPHKVAGNLYYVGSKGLSTYLVTTRDGHILINSSFERTVPIIRANVEKLGFKLSDVKILLASHAHGDHVEGHALLQELTGARVHVMQGDDEVIRNGGRGQYLYNQTWKPCKVDRVLRDGDKVSLGEMSLTAHHTPGHTRGCTTWSMPVTDNGKTLNAVIIGSPNVNPGFQLVNNAAYPEIAADYAKGFRVLRSLRCDIFLGAHGNYYDMEKKYALLTGGAKQNPFIDPQGCRAYIEDREQFFLKTLAEQKR